MKRFIILAGMAAFVLLSILAFTSCAHRRTEVTGYVGNLPIGTVENDQFLYGEVNYSNTLFGIIDTGNLDIGFQQLSSMFSTMVAAYIAGDVAKVAQTTQQLKDAGATQVQVTQIKSNAKSVADAAKQAGQTAHFSKAVDSGLFTPVPLPTH